MENINVGDVVTIDFKNGARSLFEVEVLAVNNNHFEIEKAFGFGKVLAIPIFFKHIKSVKKVNS